MQKIKIDQNNYLELDLNTGGRITHLVLSSHQIIKSNQPISDLGSGMFLMFPWISKVPENPYDPTLKCQYHGFVMNTPRKIQFSHQNENEIAFNIRQATNRQNQHNFIEQYRLTKGKLLILFQVIQNEKDKLPFCFGYHPYLQIDSINISEMSIHSDINTLLAFDQNTLPIYPFKEKEVKLSSHQKFNNLFKGGSFVELTTPNKTHLKIQSDLPYWQIYTPSQQHLIAIQPASFCGNLFQIYQQDPLIKLPTKGNITISVTNQ